jgi:hypothetical protein
MFLKRKGSLTPLTWARRIGLRNRSAAKAACARLVSHDDRTELFLREKKNRFSFSPREKNKEECDLVLEYDSGIVRNRTR